MLRRAQRLAPAALVLPVSTRPRLEATARPPPRELQVPAPRRARQAAAVAGSAGSGSTRQMACIWPMRTLVFARRRPRERSIATKNLTVTPDSGWIRDIERRTERAGKDRSK